MPDLLDVKTGLHPNMHQQYCNLLGELVKTGPVGKGILLELRLPEGQHVRCPVASFRQDHRIALHVGQELLLAGVCVRLNAVGEWNAELGASHDAAAYITNQRHEWHSPKYTCIDLASGIGGFGLGFRKAGFKVRCSCDNAPELAGRQVDEGEKYVREDLALGHPWQEASKEEVWTFGFPCQAFSGAGGRCYDGCRAESGACRTSSSSGPVIGPLADCPPKRSVGAANIGPAFRGSAV